MHRLKRTMEGCSCVLLFYFYRSLQGTFSLCILLVQSIERVKSLYICICFAQSHVLDIPVNGGTINFGNTPIFKERTSFSSYRLWYQKINKKQNRCVKISWRGKWWQRSDDSFDDNRDEVEKKDNGRKMSSSFSWWREWREVWEQWWWPRWRLLLEDGDTASEREFNRY